MYPQHHQQQRNGLDELIHNEGYMSERGNYTQNNRVGGGSENFGMGRIAAGGINGVQQGNYERGAGQLTRLNSARDLSIHQGQGMQHENNWMNPSGQGLQPYNHQQSRLPLGKVNSNNIVGRMERGNIQGAVRQQYSSNKPMGGSPMPLPGLQYQQKNEPKCLHHANKKAEFLVEVEEGVLSCCRVCAAKEAANNHPVYEIATLPKNSPLLLNLSGNRSSIPKNSHPPPTAPHPRPPTRKSFTHRPIPSIPKYQGNPIYESIIEFLHEVQRVESYHFDQYRQLEQIDQHYDEQLVMVNDFYNGLEEILEQMHTDHLADLEAEKTKNSQIADIYLNQISDNLETIDQIVEDLNENFETVVNKITEEAEGFFNEALDKNRNNIRFFSNQIEQQKEMLQEITGYEEGKLKEMVKRFETDLMELWDIGSGEGGEENMERVTKDMNSINMNNVKGFTRGIQQNHNNHQHQPTQHQQQQHQKKPSNHHISQQVPLREKVNVRQMHNNLPQSNMNHDYEGKSACRQIFDSDEEEDDSIVEKVSPNFKKI